MTAVAIWPEQNQLWIVADTRIKGDGAVLTDAASKIYGLPVICRPQNILGALHRPEPYFQGTFGAAFAGSALTATQTIAMAASCLAQLTASGTTDGPSVKDVAEFMRRIGNEIGLQIAEGRNNRKLDFELAVFGWCPRLQRFAVYKLSAEPNGTLPEAMLALEEILPTSIVDHLVTLGDGGRRVRDQVHEMLRRGPTTKHMPKQAIAEILEAGDRVDTVGGGMSIATCIGRPGGFQMHAWARPGETGLVSVYNGLDLDRVLGDVGQHRVNFVSYG